MVQIFDPIRSLMVEAKLLNWFDYKEYRLWQWFRENALERLPLAFESKIAAAPAEDAWKERMEAFTAIRAYLNDFPSMRLLFRHVCRMADHSRRYGGLYTRAAGQR